jgi:hypothetical protein
LDNQQTEGLFTYSAVVADILIMLVNYPRILD